MRSSLFHLVLFCLVLSSCVKNDEVIPSIQVDNPANMTSVEYGDVITVTGSASDNKALKSVKIELLTSDMNATNFSFELTASDKSFDFNKSFELDDRHLPSGTYLLRVTAYDKALNKSSKFIELNYGELPKELSGIVMIDKVSGSIYDLYYHDLNTLNFVQSFYGDFKSMIADSYHLLIWLSGGSTGNLITYNLEEKLINWQQSPQLSTYPYFGNLYQMPSDHNIALARGNSSVVALDKEGSISRTYSLGTSAQSDAILNVEDYVIIEEIIGSNHYLSTYVKSTGQKVHQELFNDDIVAIRESTSEEVFVATSQNNSCHFYLYDYLDNSSYEPHSIDPGSIHDFCVINSNEVIIAHSNGLQRFTISNNSMVTIASEIASQLAYDELSGTVYANVNNSIHLFDHLGNLGGVITTGINVNSFALYYNK